MPRAIWSGAIRFGLVNIPVQLVPAVKADDVSFHLLHAADDGRIRFKRVCAKDGAEVRQEEIVKAYELSRGRYVRIEPGELDALHPREARAIDIDAFVALSDIDPAFFAAAYHSLPEEGAARAFALLRSVMHDSGLVAVGRMVLRSRPAPCAVRPTPNGLAVSVLHFASSMTAAPEAALPGAAAAPAEREVVMARQLVEALRAPWAPAKYVDDYRERVLDLVHRKAEGRQVVQPAEEGPVRVVDLAEALAASLASARTQAGHRAAPAPSRAAARTRRSRT
jgi:DNA end-binding protein Ku